RKRTTPVRICFCRIDPFGQLGTLRLHLPHSTRPCWLASSLPCQRVPWATFLVLFHSWICTENVFVLGKCHRLCKYSLQTLLPSIYRKRVCFAVIRAQTRLLRP
uniref:Uncharacterized protein n=1 Tax=Anopheles dirus TaxID=7168 RepID=A0A182NWJ7_9DIPT